MQHVASLLHYHSKVMLKPLCQLNLGFYNVFFQYVFDYHPGDIFGCVADIGWITGHTYVVYGPLSNGATTVLFESTPTYPDPGRYWEMVERLRVNQFYGAPTAIRLLLKSSNSYVTKYDRSSLKLLGTGQLSYHPNWAKFSGTMKFLES